MTRAVVLVLLLVAPLHAAETFRQVVARCTAEVRREMQDPKFDAYVTEHEDGAAVIHSFASTAERFRLNKGVAAAGFDTNPLPGD